MRVKFHLHILRDSWTISKSHKGQLFGILAYLSFCLYNDCYGNNNEIIQTGQVISTVINQHTLKATLKWVSTSHQRSTRNTS